MNATAYKGRAPTITTERSPINGCFPSSTCSPLASTIRAPKTGSDKRLNGTILAPWFLVASQTVRPSLHSSLAHQDWLPMGWRGKVSIRLVTLARARSIEC